MTSDMKVCMKQRCVVEFLHVETVALTEFDHPLLNIYGGKTMDVSTVRQRMVHFSSGDGIVKDKLCSRQPCRFLQAWHAGSRLSLVKRHS